MSTFCYHVGAGYQFYFNKYYNNYQQLLNNVNDRIRYNHNYNEGIGKIN